MAGKILAKRFIVAKSGASNDKVEDLDDLGSERTCEFAIASQRILGRYPPLLMSRRAKRQIGVPIQKPMESLRAISGNIDVWQLALHLAIHHESALDVRSPGQLQPREPRWVLRPQRSEPYRNLARNDCFLRCEGGPQSGEIRCTSTLVKTFTP